MAKKCISKQAKISKVEVTSDKLSGRGGIFFFLRYVENINFYQFFENHFDFVRKSAKGISCYQFIKQLFAFFIDGTDMSMKSFDRRKQDEAYAAVLENTSNQMTSSHQVKRLFRSLMFVPNRLYRKMLHRLFIWRLNIERPEIIILFGDTMVLDNHDAKKREGVEPTYKKKNGYHPLHISWGRYLVDVIFRSGSVHCNHGTDFVKAVARLTHLIRERYSKEVPIILLTDSAFLDDKNFRFFEERLKIHYVCVGKQYKDLKKYVQNVPTKMFKELSEQNQSWRYVEFGNRLKSWSKFRRCIFTTLETEEDGQLKLELTQTDTFIYTNLGQDQQMTQQLIKAGGKGYLKPEKIIYLNHQRGKGELTHRSLKEFATKEQLPFERKGMNRAYYYFLVFSHFLFETYKQDISGDIIPITSYPNTFRRQLIDFACKVISKSGQNILKVTTTIFESIDVYKIWELSSVPPPIPIA